MGDDWKREQFQQRDHHGSNGDVDGRQHLQCIHGTDLLDMLYPTAENTSNSSNVTSSTGMEMYAILLQALCLRCARRSGGVHSDVLIRFYLRSRFRIANLYLCIFILLPCLVVFRRHRISFLKYFTGQHLVFVFVRPAFHSWFSEGPTPTILIFLSSSVRRCLAARTQPPLRNHSSSPSLVLSCLFLILSDYPWFNTTTNTHEFVPLKRHEFVLGSSPM